jgi:hypothetical protein
MPWEILPESQAAFDRMRRRFTDSVRKESDKNDSSSPHCCYIEQDKAVLLSHGWDIGDICCAAPAKWEIIHGAGLDDYTHACTAHIGALLTDALVHRIYSL